MKTKLLIICLLLLLVGCGAKKTKYVEEVKTTETENVTFSKESNEKITEKTTERTTENEIRSTHESRITNESFSATELTRTFADGSTETYKNPNWNSHNSTTNNNKITRDYSEEITADLTSTLNQKIDSLGQLIRKEDVKIEAESERKLFSFVFLIWLIPFLVIIYMCVSNPTKVVGFVLNIWFKIFPKHGG